MSKFKKALINSVDALFQEVDARLGFCTQCLSPQAIMDEEKDRCTKCDCEEFMNKAPEGCLMVTDGEEL